MVIACLQVVLTVREEESLNFMRLEGSILTAETITQMLGERRISLI